MWLVNFNYNFECDWIIELSDNKVSGNKLSDNSLTSELVGKKEFFKPITIKVIVHCLWIIRTYLYKFTNNELEIFNTRPRVLYKFLVYCW